MTELQLFYATLHNLIGGAVLIFVFFNWEVWSTELLRWDGGRNIWQA